MVVRDDLRGAAIADVVGAQRIFAISSDPKKSHRGLGLLAVTHLWQWESVMYLAGAQYQGHPIDCDDVRGWVGVTGEQEGIALQHS
jgi:hypothetical protein